MTATDATATDTTATDTTAPSTSGAASVLTDTERDVLAGVPMMQLLSPDVRSLVSELFVPVELAFGDLLFQAGEPADGYYLVVDGHVRIVVDGPTGEISAALMSPGDGFGERSMLEDAVRTATARASSSTVRLLFLHRAVFDALVRLHPSLADALSRQAQAQRLMDLFRTQHAFGLLPRDALAELVVGLESVHLGPGDVVITEGDEPDAMFLVAAGRLAATTTRETAPVGYFRTGDTVGETALVTGARRTATVSAVDEATVVRIDRARFQRLLDEHPPFRSAIEDRIAGYDQKAKPIPLDFSDRFTPDQVERSGGATPLVVVDPELQRAPDLAETVGDGPARLPLPRKFPHIRQIDEMDCGAACLGMLARLHGRPVSLAHIRAVAGTGSTGTSLAGLKRGGARIGLEITPVKASKSRLAELPTPFIAHWEGNHWVIVAEVTASHVRVADPAIGMRKMTYEEFLAGWTGYGATVQATPALADAPTSEMGLRWLWPFLRPHRPVIGAAVLLALVAAAFQVSMPLLTQSVVDTALGNQDLGRLHVLVLALVVLLTAGIAIEFLQRHLLTQAAVKVDESTLDHLTERLLSLPMSYFETRRTGDIERRISGMQTVRSVVVEGGIAAIIALAQLTVSLILVFRASTALGFAFLMTLPLYGIVMTFSARRIGPLYASMEQAFGRYGSRQIDLLKGIETVKTMGAEDGMRRALGSSFVDLSKRLTSSYRSLATFGAGVQALQLGVFVAFVYFTGRLVLNGTFTIGEYVAYNALIAFATGPVMVLLGLWDEVQTSSVLLNRLQDAFEQEPEQDPSSRRPVPTLEGRVRLDGLCFEYPDGSRILTDIDLDITPGTTVAFVGRSGSGKSTLLRVISGLLVPTGGRLSFDNVPIEHLDLRELRRHLGFVLQRPYMFDASIADNIAFGDENPDMDEIRAAAETAGAHEFISRLPMGYATPIGEGGMVLSGGQVQRIAIARALYRRPPILLFDEATSALDTESERRVKKNLDQAMRGRTAFIVAHRLSTIRDCDVIVVLDAGRIVEQGNHESLMARGGMYAYLHSQQLADV